MKRTSTEARVYMRLHQDAKVKRFDVCNVIYHKFSHGAFSFTLNGENVNVMLEFSFTFADSVDADVLSAYLKSNKNIFPEAEGRIQFVESTNNDTSTIKSLGPHNIVTGSPVIVHRCPDVVNNVATSLYISLTLFVLSMLSIVHLL